MFKVAKNLSAPIVSEILKIKVMFMTWKSHLKFHNVFHGIENISYHVPQIWNMVPLEMKKLTTINTFQGEFKKLKPENCLFRLCKPCMQSLGFVNTC